MNFYHAPLGIDPAVFRLYDHRMGRPIGIVTSGYVSAPNAEAIEEVAIAAQTARISVFHLGPREVEGMTPRTEKSWIAALGIEDAELVAMYNKAQWVSGLRHVEGFEMPVIEGAACGARPIVFDRPEMRKWFNDFAMFVPECSGAELIEKLIELFWTGARPLSRLERAEIVRRFSWSGITRPFWSQLQSGL